MLPKPAICWLRVTWTDSRCGSLLRIPIIDLFELFSRDGEEREEETEPKETSTPNHTINFKSFLTMNWRNWKNIGCLCRARSCRYDEDVDDRLYSWTTCDYLSLLNNSFLRVTQSNDHFFSSHLRIKFSLHLWNPSFLSFSPTYV